jgi:hypothetical protein
MVKSKGRQCLSMHQMAMEASICYPRVMLRGDGLVGKQDKHGGLCSVSVV